MANRRHKSMNGRNLYYLAALLLLQIASCATYSMPPAAPMEDHSLLGTYIKDDEGNKRVEISLFKDGYFHEYTYDYSEEEWYSHTGTFFYHPETLTIDFYYALDQKKWNYQAELNQNHDRISARGETLKKSDTPLISHVLYKSQIPGVYFLSYFDEERVIIELTLYEDGRFKERTLYPVSEEMWTEHGSYRLSAPSGYIVLSYDEWPEGNFSGILNGNEGILHGPEGNYIRNPPTESLQMSGFTNSI